MIYTIEQIAQMVNTRVVNINDPLSIIKHVVIDTRSIFNPSTSIFFALPGTISDGHSFINSAYQKGIKNFVVNDQSMLLGINDANILVVENVLQTLQLLAVQHRKIQDHLKVIGITGSNGKTIIKEWLSQMIGDDCSVVKSPKSYNSQVGVPLSILGIEDRHEIGIFEAGISKIGEMSNLVGMIDPDVGIFTNLGDAHDAGFESQSLKLKEKLGLFKGVGHLIINADLEHYSLTCRMLVDANIVSWGYSDDATLFRIIDLHSEVGKTQVNILFEGKERYFKLPFTDPASIENALHVCATLLHLGYDFGLINDRLKDLNPLELRLQVVQGINNSILINDAYINDFTSLNIALELLNRQAGNRKKVLVMSSILESGLDRITLSKKLQEIIEASDIDECHFIGLDKEDIAISNKIKTSFYCDSTLFNQSLGGINIDNKAVLFKGSRIHHLENAFNKLKNRTHSARLQIDLQSLEHNLGVYRSFVSSDVKTMAIVKAGAYGTGSDEVAKLLQHKGVDYLAVANADEGIELRKSGIQIPIAILNPDHTSIEKLLDYNLEPEIYDLQQLKSLIIELDGKSLKIHLKIDTGMRRLGIDQSQIPELISLLMASSSIHVKSIFSHLSSSEDINDDGFTNNQVALFLQLFDQISEGIGYRPLKHILNTAGVIRFPQYAFDMIRLGIGLYGIDTSNTISDQLEKVHTLSATVIQIKEVGKGDFVGYNRAKIIGASSIIAILNIGYADGLFRNSGNEKYAVLIKGKRAPIIGNISMDLTIVSLDNIEGVSIGDEAIIFSKDHSIEKLAMINNTIPYEILTRIAPRVVRQYLY